MPQELDLGSLDLTAIVRAGDTVLWGQAGGEPAALTAALIAQFDLGTMLLVLVMTTFGFFYGVIMPSRDMIVREITPPGSFGKVFGFVTTCFNIGGIISPLIFGAIMDHGSPKLVLVLVAAFSLIAIVTVASRPRRAA